MCSGVASWIAERPCSVIAACVCHAAATLKQPAGDHARHLVGETGLLPPQALAQFEDSQRAVRDLRQGAQDGEVGQGEAGRAEQLSVHVPADVFEASRSRDRATINVLARLPAAGVLAGTWFRTERRSDRPLVDMRRAPGSRIRPARSAARRPWISRPREGDHTTSILPCCRDQLISSAVEVADS
jgi:hypothetical protein